MAVSISEPFIRRPVGTTLLAIGLFLLGIVAYINLPVASVPNVDFPVIRVFASRPGADPSVMAATVAAPLERKLGQIAGVDQITSVSPLGISIIGGLLLSQLLTLYTTPVIYLALDRLNRRIEKAVPDPGPPGP